MNPPSNFGSRHRAEKNAGLFGLFDWWKPERWIDSIGSTYSKQIWVKDLKVINIRLLPSARTREGIRTGGFWE